MLKKSFYISLAITSLISCLPSCSSQSSKGDEPQIFERPAYKHISLTTRQSEGVEMNNEFAFKMFRDINANPNHANEANKIFSPYSLYTLFSMLANGDDGETADVILTALSGKESKMTTAELNSLNSLLLQELPFVDPTTKVSITNSMWMNKLNTFYTEFTSVLTDYYGAESFSCDFNDKSTLRKNINSWVEQSTNGLIKDFLRESDMTNQYFYNVNTAYFKGVWTVPFPVENTRTGKFHATKGDSNVKIMNVQSAFEWTMSDKEMAIRIPYGSQNYEMEVLMPNENVDIDQYVSHLTEEYLSNLSYYGSMVNLTLPKFTAECKMSLKEKDFVSTGMDKIFPGGGLSKICKEGIPTINYGLTATKILVDESGTEGGAASTVIMDSASPNGGIYIKEFNVDRPFIFIIRETSTNAILFMGKITEL